MLLNRAFFNQTLSGFRGTTFLVILSVLDSAWISYSMRDLVLTWLVGYELDTLASFVLFVLLTPLLTISVYRARTVIRLWEVLAFQILLLILWEISGLLYEWPYEVGSEY